MNQQQVKALEAEQMTERSMQNWSIMLTDGKVTVSRFTADLVFMFRDNRLMMISYEFARQKDADDFSYLSGALCSLYGEKTPAEPLKIKALMDAINPNRYKTELITDAEGWMTADGTTIYLYNYSPGPLPSCMYPRNWGAGFIRQTGCDYSQSVHISTQRIH